MLPRSCGENAYQSKYWPCLNGVLDDAAVLAAPWGQTGQPQTERESVLLDVIGAYDLLLLQGLTDKGALKRLGLSKSRDELVRELDAETGRRLSIQISAATEPMRKESR